MLYMVKAVNGFQSFSNTVGNRSTGASSKCILDVDELTYKKDKKLSELNRQVLFGG